MSAKSLATLWIGGCTVLGVLGLAGAGGGSGISTGAGVCLAGTRNSFGLMGGTAGALGASVATAGTAVTIAGAVGVGAGTAGSGTAESLSESEVFKTSPKQLKAMSPT